MALKPFGRARAGRLPNAALLSMSFIGPYALRLMRPFDSLVGEV